MDHCFSLPRLRSDIDTELLPSLELERPPDLHTRPTMATQDEGQENRRNARRPGSSATGGTDDAAAAATTTSVGGHLRIPIAIKDGSTFLNLHGALSPPGTVLDGEFEEHCAAKFAKFLVREQVFVKPNYTYIKLSSRVENERTEVPQLKK